MEVKVGVLERPLSAASVLAGCVLVEVTLPRWISSGGLLIERVLEASV